MKNIIIGLILAISICGCAGKRSSHPLHVLKINKEGFLYTSNVTFAAKEAGSQRQFRQMPIESRRTAKMRGENAHINRILSNVSRSGATNILIFFQGGLNGEKNADKRADALSQIMLTNHTRSTYPVFIGWNSGLISAWADHDFNIYHGKRSPKMARLIAPFKLVADLARILSRAPISAWEQLELGFITFRSGQYGTPPGANTNRFTIINQQQARLRDLGVDVAFHESRSTNSFRWFGLRTMLLAPPKIVPAAIVDTGGKIGWDQMLRRTKTLFTTSGDFAPGGLELFARQLTNYLANHPQVSVTIVGHSMGAIVANELIRRHGDRLKISEIVYLAAACGVEDFDRSVVPYLRRSENVHFYNVCLHPVRDSGETYGWLLGTVAPSGSLLEWIDDFYSSTETDYGRVLGKWDNAIRNARGYLVTAGDPLTRQIHIKAYGAGKPQSHGPQTHGGFDKFRFWEPDFWKPGGTSPDGFYHKWK